MSLQSIDDRRQCIFRQERFFDGRGKKACIQELPNLHLHSFSRPEPEAGEQGPRLAGEEERPEQTPQFPVHGGVCPAQFASQGGSRETAFGSPEPVGSAWPGRRLPKGEKSPASPPEPRHKEGIGITPVRKRGQDVFRLRLPHRGAISGAVPPRPVRAFFRRC